MSFDLGVWEAEKTLTDEEAGAIYVKLCEEWPYLQGDSPKITAFYRDVISKWPEIDTIPEEKVGDFDFCPWSCALDHSGMAVVMPCVWSKATEVASYIESLARKHNLLLFDPQAGRIVVPERQRKPGLLRRLFGG